MLPDTDHAGFGFVKLKFETKLVILILQILFNSHGVSTFNTQMSQACLKFSWATAVKSEIRGNSLMGLLFMFKGRAVRKVRITSFEDLSFHAFMHNFRIQS
jgi:hypothetical protein